METLPADIVSQIAEIIRRVGKREEIEDDIAENINLGELVPSLLKQNGPVRDQAILAITKFLKKLTIDPDSNISANILESIDFEKLIPDILKDKDIQESIKTNIQRLIEEGELDCIQNISDSLTENYFSSLMEAEDIKKIVEQKLVEYLENFDLNNLDDSTIEQIDQLVFSPKRIETILQHLDIESQLQNSVLDYFKQSFDDCDSPVSEIIIDSPTLKNAIEKILNQFVNSDKFKSLVEKRALEIVVDGSYFKDSLVNTISHELTKQIATTLVSKLLKP